MISKTKFYCWLLGKLERRHMTFQEIRDEWIKSANNSDGKELNLRSFHRYRDEISRLFGISIKCDKTDDYRYYIQRGKFADAEVTDWLLSSLRIASLGNMLKYHDDVVLEPAPHNTSYLEDILGAIEKTYSMRFHYCTPYGVEKDLEIVPAFVRLFHGRWYVVGTIVGSEAPRTLAFDRISNLEIICTRQVLTGKTRELMKPENYYEGCFGIMRMDDIPVETIVVRAFYPENNLIEEAPLHVSQEKVGGTDEYTDFRLTLRPTRDFMQELLWHGRKLTVLSPDSLRKNMVEILRNMTESYETGKNTYEE